MSQRTRREIIIADNSLDLKQNVNETTTEPENKNDVLKSVDVPPNKLYGHNLKKIKTFKKLRRGYKLNNQKVIEELFKLSNLHHDTNDDTFNKATINLNNSKNSLKFKQ
jgi:hypothetical protein